MLLPAPLGRAKALWRLRGYKPQPVTRRTIDNWLNQFDAKDHRLLLDLLNRVVYISEKQTREFLVQRNKALLTELSRQGIPLKKVIYVQIDDAGSSSAVMVNVLKEAARLERTGCTFLDSKDVRGLHTATTKLGEGAIVYVDDFVGTADQFCRSRDFAAEYILETFSEFLLTACICEEALYALGKRGIQARAGYLHSINERALHESSSCLDGESKQRLLELSRRVARRGFLGYKDLASMVVFYRNAPNSTPWLLRGNVYQKPYVGVLPRTTDLSPLV